MAVTHVGSDQNDRTTGTTALSLTLPTHQTDDLGIICMYNDQDLGVHSITVASGWTNLADNLTSLGRDMHTSVWYKFFTSASETNPSCNSTANEELSCVVHVFRGVDTVYDIKYSYINDDNLQDTPTGETVTPADVTSDFDNAGAVQFLCMSHDDVVTANTPTGYTLGETIVGGTKDYRQITAAYDLDVGTAGAKSYVKFIHDLNNQVCEYHMYHIILEEAQPIHITDVDTDEKIATDQENVVATGDGFESTQGTGLLELVENSDYTGTKVTQTIDSWSDTSIQFDVVQGGLSEGVVYAFVTNDSGDRTSGLPVTLGFGPYDPTIGMDEGPDVYWTMNNTYNDTGLSSGNHPFNNIQGGTPDFEATPITRTNTHSFRLNSRTDYSEPPDSIWMNITNQHERRRLGGWIQLQSDQLLPGCVFEEGGGVNNIYFVIGYGSILMANIEDDGDFAIQAYADFPLTLGRPYHIMCAFDGSNDGNEFYLLIDGVKQTVTSGNPPAKTNQVTHGGNPTFGDSQQNLQTGGQDINYAAVDDCLFAHWGSWSKVGQGIPSDTEIRQLLFENGALASGSLDADTQANMQTQLENNHDSKTHADWPLSLEIPAPSSGGPDLELTATDQVFPDEISIHIRWLGTGTLTWRNSGTSNASVTHRPGNGTVTFIETAPVTVIVQNIEDSSNVENARAFLIADTGGPLPAEESVTITRSGSTATVTHTAHGMLTGQSIWIQGANQNEYNGLHTITVTGANSYTYTVSGTPTTPATGTITSTAVILNALTSASGLAESEIDYTSNQPVTGWIRRGTSTIRYKTQAVAGTITSAGFAATVFMIPDE